MATNFRVYWKHAHLFQDLPKTGAGSVANDPVKVNGNQVGINLWGTGKGEGIPKDSDYAMVALDGTPVVPVTVSGGAITEGSPIYITNANALVTVATDNTLFGYADEPAANGATRIGVRIKAQVNA